MLLAEKCLKQVKRSQLLAETRHYPDAVIAMEACGSSHHWARRFTSMGHTVRLIPAQHVKAFVCGNKNDAHDALAIAEAALRPDLHEVQIKSLGQQDIQTLLRIRSRFKDAQRTNAHQLRGLLAEYGQVIPVGIVSIPRGLPDLLEDAEHGLAEIARQALYQLLQEHHRLTDEITCMERQ